MKYRVGKIKREHSIIERLWPVLEQMAECHLISSIIPGPISPLNTKGFEITFQRFTETGLRLLAKNGSAVQEIYAVAIEKERALAWLNEKGILHWQPEPPAPAPPIGVEHSAAYRKQVTITFDTPCVACGRPILAGSRAVQIRQKGRFYLHVRCAK